MKKLFIICTMLLFSVAFIQAQEAEEILKDTTDLTIREVYEDVKGGLNGLALALEAPAEHVYDVLVKEQKITAITYLIMLIFIYVLSIILCSITRYAYVKDWDDDIIQWFGVPGIILLIVAIIVSFVAGPEIISGFVNPEYDAIKDILTVIKT